MEYEAVIGLEVHLQLATKSKAFCGCSTLFGQEPNSQTCPVCLGMPGSLPVLNRTAFEYALKVALALNCKVSDFVKFDRKNYFYPDLPKNFQISQFDRPLSRNGFLEVQSKNGSKNVRIRRVHLEEDAGKLLHTEEMSLVDFNRSGIPLLEIVTEPDINSPKEAHEYLTLLKNVLEYLEVSDCDMEKGSLRCDANVSIKPQGKAELGVKAEVKNMNSFKGVEKALEYEIARQKRAIEEGARIVQETRLWDAEGEVTISMRSKEEAHDYRYFPEPDLVPFIIPVEKIERIRKELPELPHNRRERFVMEYGLSEYDAEVLTSDRAFADYFEESTKGYDKPKSMANWIMGDISYQLKLKGLKLQDIKVTPSSLRELVKLIDDGGISGKMAKDILVEMIETGKSPQEIVQQKGLSQISNSEEIEKIVDKVIEENTKSVSDFKNGKEKAIIFLVGQVMVKTKGKANPKMVNESLRRKLSKGG